MFGSRGLCLRWQIDLGIATGLCQIDGLHHQPNMGAEAWPLLLAENNDRNFPLRQVLLVANVLVGRQQHVEAGRFSGRKRSPFLSVSQPS